MILTDGCGVVFTSVDDIHEASFRPCLGQTFHAEKNILHQLLMTIQMQTDLQCCDLCADRNARKDMQLR